MFFSAFGPETLKQIVLETGFEILLTDIESQVERDSEVSYLWVLARRN